MSLFKPKMDPAIKAKAERPGVLVFVSVPCVSGLPVPEKTMAQVYYFEDHLEIDAGGTEYNLTLEKVQEIAIQNHVEQQTQAVSSVGGAMLGAAIAGPIGAAIGGRAKERRSKARRLSSWSPIPEKMALRPISPLTHSTPPNVRT